MAKAASRSAPGHFRIADSGGITPDLSRPEFEAFRALILARTGIALGPHKRALLQVRLGRVCAPSGSRASGTTGTSSSSRTPRATSSPASSTR